MLYIAVVSTDSDYNKTRQYIIDSNKTNEFGYIHVYNDNTKAYVNFTSFDNNYDDTTEYDIDKTWTLGNFRNLALDTFFSKSTSDDDYLMFIDDNSELSENFIGNFNYYLNSNPDMAVVYQYTRVYNGKIVNAIALDNFNFRTCFFKEFRSLKHYPFIWGKAFRKSIIKDLKFTNLQHYEDLVFMYDVLLRSNNINIVSGVNLKYSGGKRITDTNFDTNIDCLATAMKYILSHNDEKSDMAVKEILFRQIRYLATVY